MIPSKPVVIGSLAAAAGAGYLAYRGSENDPDDSDRLQIASSVAALGGAAALGGIAAYKAGLIGPTAKLGVSGAVRTASRAIRSRTGMFVGGGAAIGAAIGAYASPDDRAGGAGKGAILGAGAGVATQGLLAIGKMSKATRSGVVGKLGSKASIASIAVLGTLAVATGAHAVTSGSSTPSYSYTGADGETEYSPTPVRDRSRMMNATGDVVFGLHRRRRG